VLWYGFGGGFLGVVAGAVIGGLAGGVAVVVSAVTGGKIWGTTWWLLASTGGALAVGGVFAFLRVLGWEVPEGKSGGSEDIRDTPDKFVCRKCRMPAERRVTVCPRCGAPMHSARLRAVGRIIGQVGGVALVATWFGWGWVGSWLAQRDVDPAVSRYLFWLFFAGSWIMIGVGSLLSTVRDDRDLPSESESAGQEPSEE
jgi:hypothetical protein